jgi:hypothetical protein
VLAILPQRVLVRLNGATVDNDRPGVGRFQTGDNPKQCRLTSAGGPNDHQGVAVIQVQREILENVVCSEALVEVVDFYVHGIFPVRVRML